MALKIQLPAHVASDGDDILSFILNIQGVRKMVAKL